MKLKELNLQKQPNDWSCLPTAFAIAIDMPIEEMLSYIGHRGSEIVWSDLQDHRSRRSFHPQEILPILYRMGFAVVCFEGLSQIVPDDFHKPVIIQNKSFVEMIETNYGVLTGEIESKKHAVAWDGEKIYCPSGQIYDIEKFGVEMFFAIKSIR